VSSARSVATIGETRVVADDHAQWWLIGVHHIEYFPRAIERRSAGTEITLGRYGPAAIK